MEILLLSACGLVANQYMRLKKKATFHVCTPDEDARGAGDDKKVEVDPSPERQCVESSPASIPLGVRTRKTDGAGDAAHDEARFNEQYSHPQDPNPAVSEKPWMRMANAPYKPKEGMTSEIPGPQDVFGRDMTSRIKEIEADFATSTVPVTMGKQFDRPVEQISTGNGSAAGFHIGAGKRYHKFILNEKPPIESNGGPRGAFAGASGSFVKGDYRTVTQRSSLNHESFGPPVAAGVPQSSVPTPYFEISPSHLETYSLDEQHLSKGMRASVQGPAASDKRPFSTAHDENIQVLHTSLVTGGERFATGASGNRDVKIHVPLNNDPLVTFDKRVVPNFKISKTSDFQDQQIVARQKMIPEMSQNVSALRNNSKPPISGTTANMRGKYSLKTDSVMSGSACRGARFLPINIPADAFRAATDRKESVAEKAALASRGASASHAVQGSNSVTSSSSLFRTTNNLSEVVVTPFLRGAGSKQGSILQPIHEATDTHLSELDSVGILKGVNKFSKQKIKPVDTFSTEDVKKLRKKE